MSRIIAKTVGAASDGKKIKDVLRTEWGISHRVLCKLKQTPDGILRNGAHARAIDLVQQGDRLEIRLPADEHRHTPLPAAIPLHIVYEDDDLLVVNKPAGLAMHETHNHQGDALSNAVAHHLQQSGSQAVFRAVGRLDKGTSGLVVCAKNQYAAGRLAGHIQKTYFAVACGVYSGIGTIDAPIIRPNPQKTLRAVGEGGERAVTHWQALQTDGKCTLLQIRLETGRTHQIRVHFASCGTPLVGDDMYGSPDLRLTHQALHCGECRFLHPVTEKEMCLTAPVPADMAALLPKK